MKKNKKQSDIVFCPFIQPVGTIIPQGVLTATTVTLRRDKKGRLRDHNGKKLPLTDTSDFYFKPPVTSRKVKVKITGIVTHTPRLYFD